VAAAGPGRGLDHVFHLVLADFDDVIVLQDVLLHLIAVHQRAVGAAQVLQEGIVEYRHNAGMFPAYRQVLDRDVILGFASDRDAILVERDFPDHRPFQTEYQLCHGYIPAFSI
jgi:hypothetical protein